MARKRKTPPELVAMIQRHQEYMNYIQEMIDAKARIPLENQANHLKNNTAEYYIGLADGAGSMLENALHAFNCYAGFQYIGKKVGNDIEWHNPIIGINAGTHPEYAGWRRKYLIRE